MSSKLNLTNHFIEVSANPDKTEGFYFNVSRNAEKNIERKYKEN